MPPKLDTPARAAQIPRPQTRGWTKLLSEAAAGTKSSVETRRQLREHLIAADQHASRRKPAATPSNPTDRTSDPTATPSNPTTTTQPEPVSATSTPAPNLPSLPTAAAETAPSVQILSTITADWTARVRVLQQICSEPMKYSSSELTGLLCVQLSDIRAQVVSAAQQAVSGLAAARCLDGEQAYAIYACCAKGANVSKKVMAEARVVAARAAMHGQTEGGVFEKVAELAGSLAHARGRQLGVEGVRDAVGIVDGVDSVEGAVVIAVRFGACDKAGEVRAAAREVKTVYEGRFGEEAWGVVEAKLGKEVVARLKVGGVERKVGGGKGRAGMSMKEVIRRKRELAKKQGAAKTENASDADKIISDESETVSKKRSFRDMKHVAAGKENHPVAR